MAFQVDQRVRLVGDALPLPPGSEGVVIGSYYVQQPIVYLVSFEGQTYEVDPEQLIAADDLPASDVPADADE